MNDPCTTCKEKDFCYDPPCRELERHMEHNYQETITRIPYKEYVPNPQPLPKGPPVK